MINSPLVTDFKPRKLFVSQQPINCEFVHVEIFGDFVIEITLICSLLGMGAIVATRSENASWYQTVLLSRRSVS